MQTTLDTEKNERETRSVLPALNFATFYAAAR